MYTALILHELDEYNSGIISEKEVNAIFEEYYQNIQLLKNGGMFDGREIVPVVEEYLPELVDVENKFYEFEALKDELIEFKSKNMDPSEEYNIKHEVIEVELLAAADLLTVEIAEYFSELNHEKETLELILPVINAIVYVVTVFVIFKTLRKEQKQIQKFEKLYTIGQMAGRLAHDIKNPLAVIMASLDIVRSRPLPEDVQEKQYDKILRSAKNINYIIDDVLEFAKTKEMNVSENSVLTILKISISDITIPEDVKLSIPENDVKIECDARKIQAVFTNILVNGIYAINNKGTIDIKIEEDDKHAKISISDSGPGIPKNVLPHIFEPLFSSKPTGTGLGLGICKNIVEQHNGRLSVSQNPTTFTVELPKC